ncbi:MAG TPA: nucleotide exchange factor GrpE [Vicinamibacteria bacterium]
MAERRIDVEPAASPLEGLRPDEAGDAPEDQPGEQEAPSAAGEVPERPVEEFDPSAAEAYHQRARLAEDRLSEVLTAYRQLRLDNEDFRERAARNLERKYQQRHDSLLLRFMDILDNLDRALDAVQTSYADDSLVQGLILVRSQLLQTLQDEGLERIPVLGLPYDPHVSESVGTEEVTDPDQHHLVVREHLRGYRLNGRVARASRVVLGEYGGPRRQAAPVAAAAVGAGLVPPAEDSLDDIIARVEAREAQSPEAAPGGPELDALDADEGPGLPREALGDEPVEDRPPDDDEGR